MEIENKSIPFEMYFAYDPDVDESKAKVSISSKGNVILRWYDCSDSVSNKITVDEKGLKKLDNMEKSLSIIRKYLTENIKK